MKKRWRLPLLAVALFLCLFRGPAYAEEPKEEPRTVVPEGVTEIDLGAVLGEDARDIVEVWMLNTDVCAILQRPPQNGDCELILLDTRDCTVLSRTPVPLATYLLRQVWEGDTFCLLFAPRSSDWPQPTYACIKTTVSADGTVDINVSERRNLTVMPGGDTAIRETDDGSLYAVDLDTGEEELLIQGVASLGGGLSYEGFLAYVPCWDDYGFTEGDPWGNPHSISLPLDEDDFRGYDIWFYRDFSVHKPLDEHRFVYEVYGWEWDAGYGIYDLQTRTDHRITGRGDFFGVAGGTLFGETLKADANTYETTPLPEKVHEQLYQASIWMTNDLVDCAISPDGKLLALTGMIPRSIDAKRWWEADGTEPKFDYAHTVTLTDMETGDLIRAYDIDNPFARESTVSFYDDTRFMLFCRPEKDGSAYLYLFDAGE